VLVSARIVPRFSPPGFSSGMGGLANVLLGSGVRWDGPYYIDIAQHGYSAGTLARPVFFPLYPLLIRLAHYVVGSYAVAAVLVSLASLGGALLVLERLTTIELGASAARATVLLVAFAPLSFFFSAAYAESLFLLLSVASLLAARRDRWALAGGLAALATLTRVTGVLLVIPLVIIQLRTTGRLRSWRPWRSCRPVPWALGWVLLPVVALVGYLAALAASGWGWLAPFAGESLWHRSTAGPVMTLAVALRTAWRSLGQLVAGVHPVWHPAAVGVLSPEAESILLLGVLAGALWALWQCRRRLGIEYAAYGVAALIVCSASTFRGQPLLSLDRFVLTIFPLWMAAGAWVARRRLTIYVVPVGAVALVTYAFWFARWSFIA
jgi:Mannosyltransferase (PIG-V)